MKKVAKLFLMLALVLAVLTGCASEKAEPAENGNTETETKSAEHFIGFSAMTFSDNWMVTTSDGLEAYCKERGYDYTKASAEGVAATQVNQIENMITQGCDVILITPLDIEALHDVMKKAHDQGVTCVYIGDPFEGEEPFAICLNVDQREFGSRAAKAAAEWIDKTYPDAADGSIEVAVFQEGSQDAFLARADGLHDVEKFTKKAKIVETYDLVGQANPKAKAQEYTDQLLLKHPDVKVIISHSADYGTAIDEVIMRTAGVDPTTMGIFACDWLEAAANAVEQSVEGKSAFRAFVESGDFTLAFLQAGVGELEINDKMQAIMPLYTITAENIQDAYKMHGVN